MGLTYKILWVDDNIDNFRESLLIEETSDYLRSLGFIPTIDEFEDIESARGKLGSERYDLILSDFNIDDGGNGDVLIREMRAGNVFTEVLFYSAQANLKELANGFYEDRVSFLSIATNANVLLGTKINWLIDQTISKLQEIESVRGLVMSETSNLDSMVAGILVAYFASDSENRDKLYTKILKKIRDSAKGNLKQATNLGEKSVSEIINSRLFDADKKARAINNLIEFEFQDNEAFQNFYINYKQEVIDLRNKLAHVKAVTKDGQDYLITHEEVEEPFGQTEASQIRQSLMKYNDSLAALMALVQAL